MIFITTVKPDFADDLRTHQEKGGKMGRAGKDGERGQDRNKETVTHTGMRRHTHTERERETEIAYLGRQ